jgi:hypothetical protein
MWWSKALFIGFSGLDFTHHRGTMYIHPGMMSHGKALWHDAPHRGPMGFDFLSKFCRFASNYRLGIVGRWYPPWDNGFCLFSSFLFPHFCVISLTSASSSSHFDSLGILHVMALKTSKNYIK